MNTIYTLGYTGFKPDELSAFVAANDLTLLDIRFSPASRVPDWSGKRLRERFGSDYDHIRELGNVNYRNDGPIQLLDPIVGIVRAAAYLDTRSVVLLCACTHHETCHRSTAADLLTKATGAPVVHLTRTQVLSGVPLTPREPPTQQLSLF